MYLLPLDFETWVILYLGTVFKNKACMVLNLDGSFLILIHRIFKLIPFFCITIGRNIRARMVFIYQRHVWNFNWCPQLRFQNIQKGSSLKNWNNWELDQSCELWSCTVQQFQIERRSEEEYNIKNYNKSNTDEKHTYIL